MKTNWLFLTLTATVLACTPTPDDTPSAPIPATTNTPLAFSVGGSAGNDYGKDVAVDKDQNLILAGYFYGTVDFDPSAETATRTAVGMADNFLAKYDKNGRFRWAVSFGSTGIDIPHSVTTDRDGNVFAVGYFSGACDFDPGTGTTLRSSTGGTGGTTGENSRDGYLLKLDANGAFQWVVAYGNANTEENVFGVDTDAAGNCYVTGVFQGTIDADPSAGVTNLIGQGVQDVLLAKYSPAGSLQWAYSLGSAGQDEGSAVVIDRQGNPIFTGYFSQRIDADPSATSQMLASAGSFDTYFTKFSPDGRLLSADRVGGPGADIVAPGGIAVDATNSFYLCGNFTGTARFGSTNQTSNGGQDWFVVKFSENGLYQQHLTAGGTEGDQAHRLCVDEQGNLYITGWFRTTVNFGGGKQLTASTSGGGHDIYIAKYSASGNLLWVNGFGAAVSGADMLTLGTSIRLLGADKIAVAGRYHGSVDFDPSPTGVHTLTSAGASDVWLAVYDRNGNLK